jgi:hypothetical protein
MRKYIAFYNHQQFELEAESLWDAKQKAVKHFKPPKRYEHMVSVLLADVTHTADF